MAAIAEAKNVYPDPRNTALLPPRHRLLALNL